MQYIHNIMHSTCSTIFAKATYIRGKSMVILKANNDLTHFGQ